jgi:hypothetical protein
MPGGASDWWRSAPTGFGPPNSLLLVHFRFLLIRLSDVLSDGCDGRLRLMNGVLPQAGK